MTETKARMPETEARLAFCAEIQKTHEYDNVRSVPECGADLVF